MSLGLSIVATTRNPLKSVPRFRIWTPHRSMETVILPRARSFARGDRPASVAACVSRNSRAIGLIDRPFPLPLPPPGVIYHGTQSRARGHNDGAGSGGSISPWLRRDARAMFGNTCNVGQRAAEDRDSESDRYAEGAGRRVRTREFPPCADTPLEPSSAPWHPFRSRPSSRPLLLQPSRADDDGVCVRERQSPSAVLFRDSFRPESVPPPAQRDGRGWR